MDTMANEFSNEKRLVEEFVQHIEICFTAHLHIRYKLSEDYKNAFFQVVDP